MSKFLEELKNAVENGKINSEAANKINEIDNLAETKSNNLSETSKSMENRLEKGKVINQDTISREEIEESEKKYEDNMIRIKQEDYINSALGDLTKFENLLYDNIGDLFSHINVVENNIKDFSKIEGYDKLIEYISEMKKNYSKFINH